MRSLTVDIDVINPRTGDQFGFEVTNDGVPLIFTQSGQVDSNGWNKTYVSSTQQTVPANRFIKLNTDLSYRPESATFSLFGNQVIEDFTINSFGTITAVGSFTLYNGSLSNRIVSFNELGPQAGIRTYGSGAGLPINSVYEAPDGSFMYVGGSFTSFNGATVNRFCKILGNGNNDTTFNNAIMSASTNKGFNGQVYTIAVQTDGKILVGGSFTRFNNNVANGIVRINPNGSFDSTFNMGTAFGQGGEPHVITIQPDGKILVGGVFSSYNGTTGCNGLVRLNANGTLDNTFTQGGFNIGLNQYSVEAIKVLPSGDILVGGSFGTYKGNVRNCIVKINSTATVDYNIFGTGVDNYVNNRKVWDIQTLPTGEILIGGFFQKFNGVDVGCFVKLNADGSFHTDKISFNDPVKKILVKGSFVYVGGQFVSATVGTTAVSNLYNIPITSTMSRTEEVYATYNNLVQYNTNPYGITYSIIYGTVSVGLPDYTNIIPAEDDTTSFVVSDKYNNINTYISNNGIISTSSTDYLIRIDGNGELDTTFNYDPSGSNPPNSIAFINDKIVISRVGGITGVGEIIRLNYDGTIDGVYNVATSSQPQYILNSGTNSIYSQEYTNNSGFTQSIVKYKYDGSLDTTFTKMIISSTYSGGNTPYMSSIKKQSNDKLIINIQPNLGSSNVSYIKAGGVTYSNLKGVYRFNTDGSLDTTFTYGSTFSTIRPYNTFILSNDKILVQELMYSYSPGLTITYNRIKRFNSNGSLDTTFNCNLGTASLSQSVYSFITEQADGKVIIASDNGPYPFIRRINTDGTFDTSFDNNILKINGVDFSMFWDSWPSVAVKNNGDMFLYSGHRMNTLFDSNSTFNPIKIDKDGNLISTNIIRYFDSYPMGEGTLFDIQQDNKTILYNESAFNGTSSIVIRMNENGTLDNTFDASSSYVSYPVDIVLQPDGKMFLLNDDISVRLNQDGSQDLYFDTISTGWQNVYPITNNSFVIKTVSNSIEKINTFSGTYSYDTSFGNNGLVYCDSVFNLSKQSDNKLLLTISSTSSLYLKGGTYSKGPGTYRINVDGSLDTSFNYNATTFIPYPYITPLQITSLIQPDDKLVFLAQGTDGFIYIKRLDNYGNLDTSFNFGPYPYPDFIYLKYIQPDGKIIVNQLGLDESVPTLFRLNQDGSIDISFNTTILSPTEGFYTVKPYSNGDMLVVSSVPSNSWVSFVGVNKGSINRIDKDGTPIIYLTEEAQAPTGVRMKYDFDNDEVVLNNLYDTPNYVELTYTNTSVTINEIIQEVVVRSPHLIISTQSSFDTANYKIRIWEGSIFDGASQSVAYDITKQKLFLGQSNVYININNLVREKLEANVGNFFSTDYDFAKPLGENMSKWVQVDETLTNAGATVSTSKYRLFATDGYLYNEEIQGVPNILLTGNQRYIYKDQIQRIYFQTNFLTRIQFRVEDGFADYDAYWNVDLLGDNKNYVQSLTVDTRNFPFGNNWAEYQFDYSTGETEIVRFNIYDYCKYQPFYLVFKNKWGVLESIGLTKKSMERLTTTNTQFERSILDYNGNYDINRHTKKQFNVTGEETWTLNTDWMPEYMNQAIEEVNLSEEVWLVDSNNIPYPVTIEDNSIDYKTEVNDKLIQYTIKVKLSHSIIKNII